MERSSEFVKNKALFGSYPLQEHVNMFESIGVRYFIDLTFSNEKKITLYKTEYTYINYPIYDRRVPTDWKTFSQFIIRIGTIIKNLPLGEYIYLHCKGGHGRSGIVVACLLCYLYNITPSEALSKTTKYHSLRLEMREKWRKMGSPQTRSQKHFVTKFFEPLYVYNNYTKYFSVGFSNDAFIPVVIPGFGLFPTATSAFYAFKDPSNINYVKKLELSKNIENIRNISEIHPIPKDWLETRETIMYNVLLLKFNQNKIIKTHILNTGLRPIIVRSCDPYWGELDNSGKNILGKMLVNIRKDFYTCEKY
jgi:predicted NAD-dependent protein-ADP-ribosyltransferase YbiA (DUF1768 family)